MSTEKLFAAINAAGTDDLSEEAHAEAIVREANDGWGIETHASVGKGWTPGTHEAQKRGEAKGCVNILRRSPHEAINPPRGTLAVSRYLCLTEKAYRHASPISDNDGSGHCHGYSYPAACTHEDPTANAAAGIGLVYDPDTRLAYRDKKGKVERFEADGYTIWTDASIERIDPTTTGCDIPRPPVSQPDTYTPSRLHAGAGPVRSLDTLPEVRARRTAEEVNDRVTGLDRAPMGRDKRGGEATLSAGHRASPGTACKLWSHG